MAPMTRRAAIVDTRLLLAVVLASATNLQLVGSFPLPTLKPSISLWHDGVFCATAGPTLATPPGHGAPPRSVPGAAQHFY